MIRKAEKLLVTFYTTTAAMEMERICKAKEVQGRLIPVPGFISADCGLGWCARPDSEPELKCLMEEYRIAYQGIHHCLI